MGQAVSEEKIFEIVDGWTDARVDTGHGHPICSPCKPNSSGELKMYTPVNPIFFYIKVGFKVQFTS